MGTHLYIHIHAHLHLYTPTPTPAPTHTTHTPTHTYIHIHIHICIHIHIREKSQYTHSLLAFRLLTEHPSPHLVDEETQIAAPLLGSSMWEFPKLGDPSIVP